MTPAPAAPAVPRLQAWRRLVHIALVALGWLLFAWSWHRVSVNGPEIAELRWLMLSAVLVVPVLTLSWVAHNVGIHRRKGPRRSVPAVTTHLERDFNGRRLEADWADPDWHTGDAVAKYLFPTSPERQTCLLYTSPSPRD